MKGQNIIEFGSRCHIVETMLEGWDFRHPEIREEDGLIIGGWLIDGNNVRLDLEFTHTGEIWHVNFESHLISGRSPVGTTRTLQDLCSLALRVEDCVVTDSEDLYKEVHHFLTVPF